MSKSTHSPAPGPFSAPPVSLPGLSLDDKVQSFDDTAFYAAFSKDLSNAGESVVIQSPYITERGLGRWLPICKALVDRGVTLCIYLKEPDNWHRRHHNNLPPDVVHSLQTFESMLTKFHQLGAHVNLRPKIHEKLAIIDGLILWDGSLNILSHRDTSERMTRTAHKQFTQQALVTHCLDTCAACWEMQAGPRVSIKEAQERLKHIVATLHKKRKSISLSQCKLAKLMGSEQGLISRFERGTRNSMCETLIRIAGALGLELVLVPRILVPAVEQLVLQRTQAQLRKQ